MEISFTRFLYPDTNIMGILAKDTSLWRRMQDFLYEHDLCIAVSGAQAAELSEVQRLHNELNLLLTALPSVLVKTPDEILDEEVRSYPNVRSETLVMYYLNALLGKSDLASFLSSPELKDARRQQKEAAQQMPERMTSLKSNFPPSPSGKYSWEQAPLFVWALTVQSLASTHRSFILQFKSNASEFKGESLRSFQIFAYALFYKYYLYNKKPQLSDFGDMHHLAVVPYCNLVILEREMSNTLNHIKCDYDILKGVTITNVDFFKDWQWTDASNGS